MVAIGWTITVNDRAAQAGLAKLSPAIISRRSQKLNRIADYIQKRAIAYAYDDAKYSKTGKLRASIKKYVDSRQGRARVIADRRTARYAGFVEYGQRPHAIPNNPMWGLRGKIHPGAKGKLFMTRAGVDAALLAPREIADGVRLAIRDSGFRNVR